MNQNRDAMIAPIQRIYDGFNTGDMEAILASVHPELVCIEADGLPYGGRYEGKQGFTDLVEKIGAVYSDTYVDDIEFIVDKDKVVGVFTLHGKARATGKPFHMRMAELMTIKDGQMIHLLPFYFDTHAIRVATGLSE